MRPALFVVMMALGVLVLAAGCDSGAGPARAARRPDRPPSTSAIIPTSSTTTTLTPTSMPTTTTSRPSPTTSTPKTTTTDAPSLQRPARVALLPGQPCDLAAGVRDCIDPDGTGTGTYLIGGAECLTAFRGSPELCADRDGDGQAGYPDSG